ncbi:MAG: hypothetical protein U9Q90_11210 [Campylobacterota bacterium]|nr:hypothetical protein [Campylobacterota bacterium]
MKKGLLLSVVASTMIMAGGDIAPAPVVVEETFPQWDFSGQAVVYYQTLDSFGTGDLFNQGPTGGKSLGNGGLQLNAVGKFDYGLSAGASLVGLGTIGLDQDVVSQVMQSADGYLNGGAVTQLWGAWGNESTTFKAGRQELPKSLSPFAWSEGWNVFKNTYGAALLVNTSISNTTLVGAWVNDANQNGIGAANAAGAPGWLGIALLHGGISNLNDFNRVNGDDGIFMATVQNKSIDGLTLTGSWYYGANFGENMLGVAGGSDVNILWGDATYADPDMYGLVAGIQGGTIMQDDLPADTTAFGAKIGGSWDVFAFGAAFSSVDDGTTGVFNVGGVKTPLYTQMILNQAFIARDADSVVLHASAKALGGKFIVKYGMTTQNNRLLNQATDTYGDRDYAELDLVYKTKVWNDSIALFAGYINQDVDALTVNVTDPDTGAVTQVTGPNDPNNVVRFWARYNF